MDPGSLSVLVNTLKLDGEDVCNQSSTVKDLYETLDLSNASTSIIVDLPHSSALPDIDHDDDQVFFGAPVTPDSDSDSSLGERAPCLLHHFASPLSLTKSAIALPNYSSDSICPPSANDCTPKGSVFDPMIAPRPYAILLYPHCRQCAQEDSPSNVVRSLNFSSGASLLDNAAHQTDAEGNVSDEEILFQTIYGTLVEEIILMHTKGPRVSVGFNTPTSMTQLSGITETCPLAPVKPSRMFKDRQKFMQKT